MLKKPGECRPSQRWGSKGGWGEQRCHQVRSPLLFQRLRRPKVKSPFSALEGLEEREEKRVPLSRCRGLGPQRPSSVASRQPGPRAEGEARREEGKRSGRLAFKAAAPPPADAPLPELRSRDAGGGGGRHVPPQGRNRSPFRRRAWPAAGPGKMRPGREGGRRNP